MSDPTLSNDDITTKGPTEAGADRDAPGDDTKDTGDEPTESTEDRDAAGDGAKDTGDEG